MAQDYEEKEEIRKNLEGYKKLEFLGLEYFIPNILSSSLGDKESHILMEDCGIDFATLLKNDQINSQIYDQFEAELVKLYTTSLRKGHDSNKYIAFQVQTVKSLYQSFFQVNFGSSELNETIERLYDFLPQQINKFCFSSWDFMPSNIFFNSAGIKFIDPTESVTGIPIIDLARFSGTLEDVYHYTNARQWFKLLKKFSLGSLTEMFCLTKREAEQIYLLGRLVQTLLSLRVSIQKDFTDNTVFISRIKRYIKQLIFLKE